MWLFDRNLATLINPLTSRLTHRNSKQTKMQWQNIMIAMMKCTNYSHICSQFCFCCCFNYATKASLVPERSQRICTAKVIWKSQGNECTWMFALCQTSFVQRFESCSHVTQNMRIENIKFIPSLSKQSAALRNLTRNDVEFEWTKMGKWKIWWILWRLIRCCRCIIRWSRCW